jgi:transposase-like protein
VPWQETHPVLERHHLAQDYTSGRWTMTELCLRHGVNRNTGYKWLERDWQDGPRGLVDRSRAPRSSASYVAQRPADLLRASFPPAAFAC